MMAIDDPTPRGRGGPFRRDRFGSRLGVTVGGVKLEMDVSDQDLHEGSDEEVLARVWNGATMLRRLADMRIVADLAHDKYTVTDLPLLGVKYEKRRLKTRKFFSVADKILTHDNLQFD